MAGNFRFAPATSEDLNLLLGIAGPSGSGKTYSALRIAQGLAEGGKVCMIDTESRRSLHYARRFEFHFAELAAPFTSERYTEVINDAAAAGAKVIVIDSMSHEHEGPGGILEQHEAELDRMAGQDWAKRERVKFSAWIKPKLAHNRLTNNILQVGVHIIFCFRAKEKLALIKNLKGKIEPVSMGWQPICSSRFEYEMSSLLILPPGARGVPDLNAQAYKYEDEHRAIFKEGQPLSEETGKALAEWAGAAPSPAPVKPTAEPEPQPEPAADPAPAAPTTSKADTREALEAEARQIAGMGRQRLAEYLAGVGDKRAKHLKTMADELDKIAAEADDG